MTKSDMFWSIVQSRRLRPEVQDVYNFKARVFPWNGKRHEELYIRGCCSSTRHCLWWIVNERWVGGWWCTWQLLLMASRYLAAMYTQESCGHDNEQVEWGMWCLKSTTHVFEHVMCSKQRGGRREGQASVNVLHEGQQQATKVNITWNKPDGGGGSMIDDHLIPISGGIV
jgi:hypothetical protein